MAQTRWGPVQVQVRISAGQITDVGVLQQPSGSDNDAEINGYALPKLKENTVSIGLPAVLTKYVSGVPDLHRPGYEYPPYREAVDFKYDVHNSFFQTRVGNDSDLIHFFKSSGPELEDALLACLKDANDTMKIEVLKAGSTPPSNIGISCARLLHFLQNSGRCCC